MRTIDDLRGSTLPARARPALRVLALIVAADAVVVALHVASELGGYYAQLFNLDAEQNLPTWLSSVQFFGVAICGVLAGLASAGRRAAWWFLAAVFAFFSVDEVALVHEKLAERLEDVTSLPKLPLIYSPLLLGCVVAVVAVLPEVRSRVATPVPLLAGFFLLAVSLFLDAADVQALDVPRFRPMIVLEEAAELLGTGILIATLLAVFLSRSGDEEAGARRVD
jgi:hypothetical protein